MEAHTPKREAVQRFISSNAGHAPGWKVRVIDEHDSPLIRLEAKQDAGGDAVKTLEVHTRQVTLTQDEVDASTRKMLVRWLDSLTSGSRASSAS
jgi:hypothetical protein